MVPIPFKLVPSGIIQASLKMWPERLAELRTGQQPLIKSFSEFYGQRVYA
jgi:hypothetical protein